MSLDTLNNFEYFHVFKIFMDIKSKISMDIKIKIINIFK